MAERYNRLVHVCATLILVLAIVLCLVLAYRHLNIESSITLIVFNLFFLSLLYQLSGSITRKTLILACGNIMGLTWNYAFQNILAKGLAIFGEPFNVFFNVFYPLLTLTWIVPFWSLSLSILPKPSHTRPPT